MYRNRLIPCLLLHGEGLVKTIRFKKPNYLGDPINAIRLFNDKEVDELMFLDIDASRENREPNYNIISKITDQCFMPLCYGGGISSVESIEKILKMGVEKIAICKAAYENPNMVKQAVEMFGSSTIVGVMDIDLDRRGDRVVKILNGKKVVSKDVVEYAKYLESLGVGEILVNDIYNDGLMQGYDVDTISTIAQNVQVPVIACGGAGNINDCNNVTTSGASAAAAGSIFVYYGRLHAVLINYPEG